MGASNIETLVSRLADANVDYRQKLAIASDIRDGIDGFMAANEYEQFLSKVLPEILKLLETVPISFTSSSPEQRLRSCLLDIILRLQTNETLKPRAPEILKLVMNLLRNENEDNGVLCMKILTSLHRAYKAFLFDQVQPFLDLVMDIYKNIPQVVKELFSASPQQQQQQQSGTPPVLSFQSPRPLSPTTGSDFGSETSAKLLPKSMQSFKVLTECPIIIVLLYSTHKQIAAASLNAFIPHIVEMLSLQAAPQAKAHQAAVAKGEIQTSISPQIKNRAVYGEFIVAQVKTMSFLAYALRGFPAALRPHHQKIPDFVVRLLQDCPCELSAARKELLVATRHILSTDFRTIFIPKVDILLSEKVLIGDGLTVHETLRPLAYSTMADLVHHVRSELKPEQIWKVVRVYCKNMQDNTLATSFQIMSAKLLLNLVERIMKLPDKQEGREIMVLILNAFVERFASLNRSYRHVMKKHQQAEPKKEVKSEQLDEDKMDIEIPREEMDFYDVLHESVIHIHSEPTNSSELKDARYIFKNLMNFLKTVMFGLKSCNPPPPSPDYPAQQWQESARLFTYEQITIFRQLFREGISGHLFFAVTKDSSQQQDEVARQGLDATGPSPLISSTKDEKDLMEAFATIFIHIDPASFNELVGAELPFLYEAMFENPALLHIPQFFLASEATSANFSGLLLAFLKDKLPELGEGDPVKSNILIRLLKLCFMAVTLFPAANETVLLSHLRDLIIGSMELATTAKEPLIYFNLLRTLFRSIGGGRFEMLYKEVLPLLQVLLESLNRLISTARRPQERDIYVELCLTVPVRLSVLVPHLSYLMRPLVIALNGNQELVSQGLRTLELCVDNLTAEYFDPIIEPVIEEVMTALWKHLRPLPYTHQHSHTTLRVLGKLGGRNRRFLKPPHNLDGLSLTNQKLDVVVSLNGILDRKPVTLMPAINTAMQVLDDVRLDVHYKRKAYEYLACVMKLFIDSEPLPSNFEEIVVKCVKTSLVEDDWTTDLKPLPESSKPNPTKNRLQSELVKKILESIFIATSVEEIREEALSFIKNLCEHMTILELGDYLTEKRKSMRTFSIDDHEGESRIDPRSILDAVISALCHFNSSIRESGLKAIRYIYDTGVAMFGSSVEAHKLPMFRALYGKLSHTCFEQEYYRKAGACLGLKVIIKDLALSLPFFASRQIEFVRTMLFVLKDVPSDVPGAVKEDAKELLFYVLKECNQNLSEEKLEDRAFKQISGFLTYELGNANESVRETSKKALAILADAAKKPVAEIMKEVKQVLLKPIFGKPLRALPFPMQIGHIDAITYCLGLPGTFIEFNDEFNRLMMEALALVGAEDDSLTTANRAFEHRTAKQLVQLRIVCIKLLSLSLTTFEELQQPQSAARGSILEVFFKTLYSQSSEVVDAAHVGLAAALSNSGKLPKDLLQNGLKPILMNLSDHKRLTVAGLEGLARLLELMTSYFKVEIGKKLLDHLRSWADPIQLHVISAKTLTSHQSIRIIVAILNIFHLLPNRAYIFMPELVQVLIFLENNLRRQQYSPFQEPIAKFMNKYSQQAFEFFTPKIAERNHGKYFVTFMSSKFCEQLRTYTKEHFGQIVEKALDSDMQPTERATAVCNLIGIMGALSKNDYTFISSQKEVLEQLSSRTMEITSTAATVPPTSPLCLQVEQGLQGLQSLMVSYFESSPDDVPFVFSALNCILSPSAKLSSEMHDFLFNRVVSSTDYQIRKMYLSKSIEVATGKSCHSNTRAFIFKFIVNPILIVEGYRHGDLSKLLDKATGTAKNNSIWLDLVHSRIWRPTGPDTAGEECNGTIDHYKFELLKMSALLIRYGPKLVADSRKDIIKFGWNFIKLEDIVSKQSAYVLIACFIAAYDTLAKIVGQIYNALLKTNQNEARNLVKQSLDLMAPVLPKRIQAPLWAKYPRKVLSEDGHNVGQVVNIYQFIVRYPSLFFEYRDHFVATIISALPKLAFVNSQQSENHVLAVELAELILKWENMAKEQQTPESKAKSEVEGDQPAVESMSQTYTVPFHQREACVTYLIRFVCMSHHKVSENALGQRILSILSELLSDDHWPEVSVKLTFFERSLIHNDMNDPQSIALALNALEVISITSSKRDDAWVLENVNHLERLLEKSVKSDNIEIQATCEKVVSIVLTALKAEIGDDEDIPEGATSFIKMINDAVSEHLSNGAAFAGITLASTLANYDPQSIDPILPSLMKVFGKLCKEHLSRGSDDTTNGPNTTNSAGLSQASSTVVDIEAESQRTVKLLIKTVELSSLRISYLGDQRRVFLSLLAQLIERSNDKQLCTKVIECTRKWVFSKTDLFPTTKEKAAILGKMLSFEAHGDKELTRLFYEVVMEIYESPDLNRSELSVRMEHPFMIGTRLEDIKTRKGLMSILSDSLDNNILKRLTYILADQNWESLSDYHWINQALQLLYGGMDTTIPISLSATDYQLAPLGGIVTAVEKDGDIEQMDVDSETQEKAEGLDGLLARRLEFINNVHSTTAKALFEPLIELQYQSVELSHAMWVNIFPVLHSAIPNREKSELLRALITLLSKEYHNRQIDRRPNVIQTLLEGCGAAKEHLPPHLVKFLGQQFNGWYSAIQIMEQIESNPHTDSAKVAESNLDALVEMYAGLQENDMFYGLWRRRAKYTETNTGLSYEQCGMWSRALQMYEAAQIKARSGVLPYGESEYYLWEDHWILCTQKLQQWEILTELAKHEGFTDLLLECGWRVADWTADKEPLEQSIKTVMDVPTPRRQVFETFLCLQAYGQKAESIQDLSRYCDEGIQLALRKWYGLPSKSITGAHIPLLHTFQQYVEFMEASQVYLSLQQTTAQNLDQKSQELKGVLQAWRERLPNFWDDINIWGDLATWRQHAFSVINKTYLPLIPALQQANGGNNSTNSYAYRGYHEIAWIINRFAHVARKHNMPEVCINQLAKIYTLPNIEIQEAFLKLREQAKCHYQNPKELNTGLDVISNTNLVYFGAQQKAEFFTLKGMFLAKLGVQEDANQAFSNAVQIDLYLPKAWAEWGYFNDRRFKEHPEELLYAANAISCYLQAAGLYKNAKTRKLLGRILWLISLDDPNGSIAQAFENYRGEIPVWYWITYIPQLLTSLAHKEANIARVILIKIAKTYPQALHFHLRTTKEDYSVVQRQAQQAATAAAARNPSQSSASPQPSGQTNQPVNRAVNSGSGSATNSPVNVNSPAYNAGTPGSNATVNVATSVQGTSNRGSAQRQPWEYVDEIMGILKTAYPLLALSLETFVDQIYQRFKCPVDEDAYRLIVALLNDGIQYMGRLTYPKEDAKLPPATESNITRFAESVLPKHIKTAFEADFVKEKPNLEKYVMKLRLWRDRFEEKLDSRPQKINLESLSPHLSEFHYQKFEDIEVPGQYFELRDNNTHFVKIERFMPSVDVVRGSGTCYRRITLLGHDGSLHPFAVQYPAARHSRREERVTQLFKILNSVIARRKESKSRYLQFTLPVAVPLTPHIRIVQDDSRNISMQAIYEDYCRRAGQSRDAPMDLAMQKLRAAFDPSLPKPDVGAVKTEILTAIQSSLVPTTVFRDYFMDAYGSFADFWLFRKQFSYQYAGITFMTFLMCINNRYPHKFLINTGSGNACATEMLPTLPPSKNAPTFQNGEPVPFRLTPNIQTLMGPTSLEGLYSMAIMIIAKGLTEPEFDLDQYLSIFVRDELISWYTQQHRPSVQDQQLRDIVKVNVEAIVKRAMSLAQHGQGNIPANQTIMDLISQAVNPRHLALTDNLWMPYL
ncbi:transcription-associated protein 1 [Trichomonascus vanleenenianus]|uniref:histone acetyltransferase TRA1 n=1 Tax=Trichomonascus vanleenenianus TaxID=2268995 RepID=UPI003EC9B957